MNVTQVSCKGIFIIYKLTFNSNSSILLCVTVTQDPCNVFPLFPSGHSILLLLFVSLLTHFHNYAVWTATHFFCFFFTQFSSGTVSFLVGLLLHKVPVTFLLCFEVYTPFYCFLLSHWWLILIIILFRLLHIINVTKVLCWGISIVFKWTLSRNCSTLLCVFLTQGFILFIWVIHDPFLFLCCVDCHTFFFIMSMGTPIDCF